MKRMKFSYYIKKERYSEMGLKKKKRYHIVLELAPPNKSCGEYFQKSKFDWINITKEICRSLEK